MVSLDGPATGRVLRWVDGQLRGHKVSPHHYEGSDPQSIRNFAGIGFTGAMQRQGVWEISEHAFDNPRAGDWREREVRNSATLAHYNPETSAWHVVRLRPDAQPSDADWASQWQTPSSHLTAAEVAAIAGIAEDTGFLLDAVSSLGSTQSYREFTAALAGRAMSSGNSEQIDGMNGSLQPSDYVPDGLGGIAPIASYDKLSFLGDAVYRTWTGRSPDSSGVLAVRSLIATPLPTADFSQSLPTIEAAVCPPFQPVDLGY